MIYRVWHGWTIPENADTYENLLKKEIFVEIGNKEIPGYRGIDLLRLDHDSEVEFVTIMRFDNIKDVIAFAGKEYTRAYVPEKARAVLKRFDQVSKHYTHRYQL